MHPDTGDEPAKDGPTEADLDKIEEPVEDDDPDGEEADDDEDDEPAEKSPGDTSP